MPVRRASVERRQFIENPAVSPRLGLERCLGCVSNLQFLTDGPAANSNLWENSPTRHSALSASRSGFSRPSLKFGSARFANAAIPIVPGKTESAATTALTAKPTPTRQPDPLLSAY